MEQKQFVFGNETSPAKLSWEDMVDLPIQVDYEAIIFPAEDDSSVTSELHLSKAEDGPEIQGETVSSATIEAPPLAEVKLNSSLAAESTSLNSDEVQQACQPSPRLEEPKTKPSAGLSSEAPYSRHHDKNKRKPWHTGANRRTDVDRPKFYQSNRMPRHASAVTMIPRSMCIEEALKHINDLTQQVTALKTELHERTCDLHEEREQRIEFQVDCKAQKEQIAELEKSLERERSMRLKSEEKEEKQETFTVTQPTGASKLPRIPTVTVCVSVLHELAFLKRQAEKNASREGRMAEAFVEERELRLKYEEQLKTKTENDSRLKEQEELIKSLKNQVSQLTAELKLPLKKEHHEASSQTEESMKTEASCQKEAPMQNRPQRNRCGSTVRGPHHENRRQNPNGGFNPNPGVYINAGHHLHTSHHRDAGLYMNQGPPTHGNHHPTRGLQANRRFPPYRGY
ncbi:uncharacterized protein LOC119777830 [Cyprinodon tularosa]|uniref:uncharacterized protein LOC119777830 n=1 Tax=Cyprinodon tularosa TaxID=77115 RepID=UPI0018E2255A|nr:uncharacterized protein LOC119777830 [Cyprinodon tularosa]